MGRAATFRAAENSEVLGTIIAEHRRARNSREVNISPFLRAWTHAGVVGHLRDTQMEMKYLFALPPPAGRGLQAWATRELRKEFDMDNIDKVLVKRFSVLIGAPVTLDAVRAMRARLVALRKTFPQVVQSSLVKAICNAWTTTGRFSGPRLPCPLGCGTPRGDKWAHFPTCTAIRRMWAVACPSASTIFVELTLERTLLLSSDLLPDEDMQVSLWTDVVGHCVNDARATGSLPSRVFSEGDEMMIARLRCLAVQSDTARAVIQRIRAAIVLDAAM
jgi:hypothetical protein